MGFVTLICLVVAAYFLWEALRERKYSQLNHPAVSSARRVSNQNSAATGADYKNTSGESATTSNSTDSNNTDNENRANTGVASGTQNQPSTLMRDSANDSNVEGIAVAAAGVAGVVAATASSSSNTSLDKNPSASNEQITDQVLDAGTGKIVDGHLRFLDAPIGRQDDLTHIDGVGPVIEEGLNSVGIYHYHQIANFTETDIVNIDTELGFPGRVNREDWVGQARKLSSVTLESSLLDGPGNLLNMANPSAVDNLPSALTDADYTGVWNTDVMIEVQERLKVLNTRISDAPRLRMTRDEYTAIKANEDEALSRDRLLEILERLRKLDQ